MLGTEDKVTLVIGNIPQSLVLAMMQAAQQARLDLALWLRLVVEAELKRGQITGLYGSCASSVVRKEEKGS